MAKRLPVPPDLEHLLEKREQEKDRRAHERRAGAKGVEAAEAAAKLERRRKADRRRRRRRKADKN